MEESKLLMQRGEKTGGIQNHTCDEAGSIGGRPQHDLGSAKVSLLSMRETEGLGEGDGDQVLLGIHSSLLDSNLHLLGRCAAHAHLKAIAAYHNESTCVCHILLTNADVSLHICINSALATARPDAQHMRSMHHAGCATIQQMTKKHACRAQLLSEMKS